MAISVRTRKLLWSTAKGRCAICGTSLIASRSDRDEATSYDIVGEECHIVSRRQNGPRSVVTEALPGAEIDGYDNLVLLCLADHKVIDDNPDEYPVARLRQIKQSHVQRMQADETLPIVPAEIRLAHLERELGRSKGRLIAGWIAVGLDEQLARELAEDDAVGTITDASLLPDVDRPLVIWVAALGSGKTVAAERIHQRGLLASLSDPDEPLPLYLHASEVGAQLEERIEAATATIDADTGYRVILDGLDEVDIGEADRLLRQARAFVHAGRTRTAVLTSRPGPFIERAAEVRRLPLLTTEESSRLIERVSGSDGGERFLQRQPASVRDAAGRPMFALLLALARTSPSDASTSRARLIRLLVERALPTDVADRAAADALLLRLAAAITGSPRAAVGATEFGSRQAVAAVLATRLVILDDDHLRFALPIVGQWCAAQALLAGSPPVEELVRDELLLERWHYPIAIASSTASRSQVDDLLLPIARLHPATLPRLLEDGFGRWTEGGEFEETAEEAATRLRGAVAGLSIGLGQIAGSAGPVVQPGVARPLIVDAERPTWVMPLWYWGTNVAQARFARTAADIPEHMAADWNWQRAGAPGGNPAWPWAWALGEFRPGMERLLNSHRLPVDHAGHQAEMTWLAAQTLMNRGSLNETRISAPDLLERLERLPPEARFVRDYRGVVDMQPLRNASPRIAAEGALEYPWATHEPPESRNYGPFVWSDYDAELLGRRTVAIYESALHLYEQLVARWFPRFASRLNRSMLLPAEAVMTLVMPSEASLGPSVTWHLEPLPEGEVTRARIAVGVDRFLEGPLDSLWDRATRMRPRTRPWLSVHVYSEVLEVFGNNPMTRLAYHWLSSDLVALGWLDRATSRYG